MGKIVSTAMIKQWYARWRTGREQKSLARRQRAALAAEIGLPEDFLERLMTYSERSSDELDRMLTALGLDAQDIRTRYAAQLRDISVPCSECETLQRCRHELAAGTARANYHDFCPNAAALDELQGEIWCDRKERRRKRIHPFAHHSDA
jgi:hypothetical protein